MLTDKQYGIIVDRVNILVGRYKTKYVKLPYWISAELDEWKCDMYQKNVKFEKLCGLTICPTFSTTSLDEIEVF